MLLLDVYKIPITVALSVTAVLIFASLFVSPYNTRSTRKSVAGK